jgi:5'-methylthioadenosine phosphorylase
MDDLTPEVAVIGGSGFYRYLEDAVAVERETPYGAPSAPITVGMLAGRPVAFLPRHGLTHQLAPHQVNYRANLWALRDLGVRRVVGSCAVGSLRPDRRPGDLVVLDQLIDRTWGRPDTYVEGPDVHHVSFADPYCPALSAAVGETQRQLTDLTLHPRGTVVVIQGPRFSTRAESRWFGAAGADVINMTQYPEAYLARELGLCYAGLALVTDYDAGTEADPGWAPVTMQAVLAVLTANIDRARRVLAALMPALDGLAACVCSESRVR